ncbi:MAG TPA: aspartate aminotransferase [Kosmotogaceae bacterium]|nr:MAG: Aspartate/tyrosine/aromatic aminotransferase [Thermotogales bacterium 46_20]HAA85477.1 aspartate aminotransferase [Kosmotogaceae bacterium]
MDISRSVHAIRPSQTLQFNKKVLELIKAGVDVVKLTAGEPDFNTPEEIVNAAIEAMNAGRTKYTDSSGIVELREGITRKLIEDNGLKYDSQDIVVTNGVKQALYSIFKATLNDNDQVILITPCWVSYEAQIRMNGGEPVLVQAQDGNRFVPDVSAIRQAITQKTRAIVINSPNNPTGTVYPHSFFKELAEVAIENDLFVVSDEVYERLIFEGHHHSIASEPFMKDRTVVVNGFSKSHAMTGWRVGYMAGPTQLSKAVARIQDHLCSNVNTIAQYAALRALTVNNDSMKYAFMRRRQLLAEGLSEIGLEFTMPEGAFYFFVDVRSFLGSEYKNSLELSLALLEKARVGVVPGSAFNYEGYIRLSYAASEEDILKAVQRMRIFFMGMAYRPS